MMILLRWPAMLLISAVIAFVLFKVFVWLLNSRYLTRQIDSVAHPRAETTEEIRDGVNRAKGLRDERIQVNTSDIERAKAENADLKKL